MALTKNKKIAFGAGIAIVAVVVVVFLLLASMPIKPKLETRDMSNVILTSVDFSSDWSSYTVNTANTDPITGFDDIAGTGLEYSVGSDIKANVIIMLMRFETIDGAKELFNDMVTGGLIPSYTYHPTTIHAGDEIYSFSTPYDPSNTFDTLNAILMRKANVVAIMAFSTDYSSMSTYGLTTTWWENIVEEQADRIAP